MNEQASNAAAEFRSLADALRHEAQGRNWDDADYLYYVADLLDQAARGDGWAVLGTTRYVAQMQGMSADVVARLKAAEEFIVEQDDELPEPSVTIDGLIAAVSR
jgi:hypothetical protein